MVISYTEAPGLRSPVRQSPRKIGLTSQRVLLVHTIVLCLLGGAASASAQTPGQLPAQTFDPVFDTNVGHTTQMQEVALSGGSTVVLEYDAATYTVQWPDHRMQSSPLTHLPASSLVVTAV